MNATYSPAAPSMRTSASDRAPSPSFVGIVRGEAFKLAHQRTNWLLLLLLAGATSMYYLFAAGAPGVKEALRADALTTLVHLMARELAIIRSFIGIFLLIATARMIGLEYQLGTIRVVLARGTGRLQLLGAKLFTMVLAAIVVLAGCLLLAGALTAALVMLLTGNLGALDTLTGDFWRDTGIYVVSMLISMADTILLAAAVTVLTRSLAFGLSLALTWFAADNILVGILALVAALTGNDLWEKVTGYFLGPELNLLPILLVPPFAGRPLESIGFQPAVHYDTTHALVVALVYGVVFLAVATALTWRRDVLE